MDSTTDTPKAAAASPEAPAPAPDARRDRLAALLPGCEVTVAGVRTYAADVPSAGLHEAVLRLRGDGVGHLATIIGEDLRDRFLVTYVMAGDVVVLVRVSVERERPDVPSLAALIPGAMVYEREIHDLLGIVPVGHPDLRRQVLPESFPAGVYPLRKDAVLPKPAFVPEEGE